MSTAEATGSSDIDPIWAGDGSHLPDWFVDAQAEAPDGALAPSVQRLQAQVLSPVG